MLELVLVISVVLQFAAAFLALRLIWITEGRKAWVFIAIAVSLMGLRRAITLARLLAGDLTKPPDLVAEMVALVISILMIFGIVWIAPLFRRLRTSEAELRDSRRMLYSTLDAI
ncbi:MAG: PAS domain-containing sensor histidine kinase, partial [SAR324 cluster bacterium]|nr:PAS domain-containing sensor histidine kinase [SAR324 cluster bacterium]